MIDGVIANMIVAVELIQKVIDPMSQRKFGRIVNITSSSVKMPLAGLDLSSGARAGLTAFLAGVARTVAANNVTINNLLPGAFDTDRLRSGSQPHRRAEGQEHHRGRRRAHRHHPGRAASAIRPSSATPAPSCARRRPATSPDRIC